LQLFLLYTAVLALLSNKQKCRHHTRTDYGGIKSTDCKDTAQKYVYFEKIILKVMFVDVEQDARWKRRKSRQSKIVMCKRSFRVASSEENCLEVMLERWQRW